jgi:hypothetical protein
MALFGLASILVGSAGMKSGHFSWENWRGYTVFAPGISAMGVGLIVLGLVIAIVPLRWANRVLSVEHGTLSKKNRPR